MYFNYTSTKSISSVTSHVAKFGVSAVLVLMLVVVFQTPISVLCLQIVCLCLEECESSGDW
jgi:hypothetical protein